MECEICLETFSYSCKPYSLYPCGHSYCMMCLDRLEKQECPKCKNEIKDKQVNFSLLILVSDIPKKLNDLEDLKAKFNEKFTIFFQKTKNFLLWLFEIKTFFDYHSNKS